MNDAPLVRGTWKQNKTQRHRGKREEGRGKREEEVFVKSLEYLHIAASSYLCASVFY